MAVTADGLKINMLSLQHVLWHREICRRSNNRTVPSSPQLRKIKYEFN